MYKLLLFIALVAFSAAAGWHWLSPEAVLKRDFGKVLRSISTAVATQDRLQIKLMLNSVLTDSAEILLEVHYSSAPGQKAENGDAEHFTKPDFMRFVDNMLYTLSDYKVMESIASAESDVINFTGWVGAKGEQMDGNMRFIGSTDCKARVVKDTSRELKISKMSCVMQLHYALGN